ncbi:MAG: hypothetical protein RR297_11150 [Clostridia bacterium]
MAVCQAFTGGGGWSTSIFMNADQKPFFTGTGYSNPPYGHKSIPPLSNGRTNFIRNSFCGQAILLQ